MDPRQIGDWTGLKYAPLIAAIVFGIILLLLTAAWRGWF